MLQLKSLPWVSIFLLLNSCTKPSEICENSGGKWGSVKSECIRPSCAKTKTCGKWASPARFCAKVKIGDSKDDVRFWLGEPDGEMNNTMTWTAFKSESQMINAEFIDNKLTKFNCPTE